MITLESIDGQTLGPYGRLRFWTPHVRVCQFFLGKGGQPRQLKLKLWDRWEVLVGATDHRAKKNLDRGSVVVGSALRHVLHSEGEDVGGCRGLFRLRWQCQASAGRLGKV